MAKTKPDPITHAVLDVAVMLVVEPLVDCLSLLQSCPGISKHFIAFSHGLGHRSHPSFTRLIGSDGGWLTAVDELEWRGLECELKGGVVEVFRPWQPAQPLMGAIVQQGWQEISRAVCPWRRAGAPSDACPSHPVISVLEGHGECAEIPEDRAKGGQPLGAEDDVVTGQR